MRLALLALPLLAACAQDLDGVATQAIDAVLPGETSIALEGEGWTPMRVDAVAHACRAWNAVLVPARRCSLSPAGRIAATVGGAGETGWTDRSFDLPAAGDAATRSAAMLLVARAAGVRGSARCGATTERVDVSAGEDCRAFITAEDFTLCRASGSC